MGRFARLSAGPLSTVAAQAQQGRDPGRESASLLRLGPPWVRGVLAGVLLAGSLPPWGFWPLAFAGMALWVELLAGAGVWQRAGRSALVSVSWLGPATVWMIDLTLVGWPLAVIGFAAMHAAAGALVPPDHRRRTAFCAALVLAELLRWTWPFGGVPLATMAMGQVSSPLGSVARIGGPLLLTALTAVGGVTLAAVLSGSLRPAAVGAAVLVAAGLAGTAAPGAGPVTGGDGARITVAAVQGGGPQNTRADLCEQRAVFERHLNTTAEQVSVPVDLVLWPEDVVHPSPDSAVTPARCEQPLLTDREARTRLSDLARELDTVLLAGFFERSPDGQANLNYSLVYLPDGTEGDRYDKVQRVPFGEYVPLRSTAERFSEELPPRDLRAGPSDEPATVETPLGPLAVSISWEIFFDHRARSGVGDGEGLIVLNPTNGSSYWLTVVQSQQIASSRLRAIETDRWVVQASPTGFSAVIDPDGNVIERTGVSESRVIQTTVELRHGDTLAVRLGAWPVALASVLTLSLALGLGRVLNRSRPGRKS